MELVSVEDNFSPVRVNDFIQVVVINLWMRLTKWNYSWEYDWVNHSWL